jgi:hypothetical protein
MNPHTACPISSSGKSKAITANSKYKKVIITLKENTLNLNVF